MIIEGMQELSLIQSKSVNQSQIIREKKHSDSSDTHCMFWLKAELGNLPEGAGNATLLK